MIASLEVLTPQECVAVHDRINRLRPDWIARGSEPASFFTLGTPSYLDLAENPHGGYHEIADTSRPILLDQFGWLYQRLETLLAEHLRGPVRYPPNLALPGFHIWLAPAIFVKPLAPIHFDLQYRAIEWPADADPTRLLSFTLAIRLPAAGGGLNIWDATYRDFETAAAKGWIEGAADLTRFHTKQYLPYRPGRMIIHSGHTLHQVAPSSRVEPDDERVTLQGHGMWCAGEWWLYW